MAGNYLMQRTFAGGEIAPSCYARADTAKFLSGLRTCQNFFVQKHGGVANRGGTQFWAHTNSDGVARLIPFKSTSDADVSVLIELGNGYMRFYSNEGVRLDVTSADGWGVDEEYAVGDVVENGGTFYYCILAHTSTAPDEPPFPTYWYEMPSNGSGGAIYQIPTPWAANISTVQYKQHGFVLTFTSHNAVPHELYRLALDEWALVPIAFGPNSEAPVPISVTPGAAGTLEPVYLITTVRNITLEESLPSGPIEATASAFPTTLAPNVLLWNAATDALEYNIYKDPHGNGLFGYIGTAVGQESFNDTGFAPDYTITPPQHEDLFASENNYPRVVGTYGQRRYFANTILDPEKTWGSRIGYPANFAYSTPLQLDDSLSFEIAGDESQIVRHLVSLDRLVVLTENGEWIAYGEGEGGTITPTSINMRQQGWVGASYVQPVVIGNVIIYLQARGSIVRELTVGNPTKGLSGQDLSIYASHMFQGYTISRIAFAANPNNIAWFVRSDGVLLGLTYIPEQDVWGWHRHTTDGEIEDVCVLPIGNEDVVFVIVNRENGRFIERMMPRAFGEDAFYVDSGITASGSGGTVDGLDHLEGQAVRVVADGEVLPDEYTVDGGEIDIPGSPSVVQVGLPIDYVLETLDIDAGGSGVRGHKKRVQGVTLLVERSSRTFYAGPGTAPTRLTQYQPESWDGSSEVTKALEMNIQASWERDPWVRIEQRDPAPLAVLGILPYVEMGAS